MNFEGKRINQHFALIVSVVFIMGATLFVYWKVGSYEFTNFDDNLYVSNNPYVQKGLSCEGLKWALNLSMDKEKLSQVSSSTYWHPLTWLSHMLDCQVFGSNPGRHHLVNLFIHILNALLLFTALRVMTNDLWKSAFVAALFALHPLNVDSVAWISERKNLLSTLFWMLTLLAYIHYSRQVSLGRYIAVVLLFTLGLFAKPMIVTLPFVLLLLDVWPLGRLRAEGIDQPPKGTEFFYISSRRWPFLFLEKIPLLCIASSIIILTIVSMQHNQLFFSPRTAPMGLRIENVFISYIKYIYKIIWPHSLAVYYPFPTSIPLYQVIGSIILLIFITLIVLAAARKIPALTVGWLWFIGTLVPVCGIVQGGLWPAMADRWAYIPGIGFFIMVAWGGSWVLRNNRNQRAIKAIFAAVVLICCIAISKKQTTYWKDSIALFSHELSVAENNSISHLNLGTALAEKGMVNEAIGHFHEALRLDPNYTNSYSGLGAALISKGETDTAIDSFNAALKIMPENVYAYIGLGMALVAKGQLDQAASQYNAVLKMNPNVAIAHFGLGSISVKKGDFDEAIKEFRKAIALNPLDATTYNSLGAVLGAQGHISEAILHFEKALQIDPNFIKARNNLNYLMSLQQIKE